eukprot:1156421-Pelagomonas_calceolata.AAC.13
MDSKDSKQGQKTRFRDKQQGLDTDSKRQGRDSLYSVMMHGCLHMLLQEAKGCIVPLSRFFGPPYNFNKSSFA